MQVGLRTVPQDCPFCFYREHLSESTSSNTGLSLSQLLDEVEEDQEHWGALVHLAESCLMLAGPCTASPLTRWAASCHRAMGEVVYTVPSLWLHISENDQRILSSLHPGQKTQGLELPPPDPALQELSLTLISSSSSPSSSGKVLLRAQAFTAVYQSGARAVQTAGKGYRARWGVNSPCRPA